MAIKPTTSPSAQWPDKVPASELLALSQVVPVREVVGGIEWWGFDNSPAVANGRIIKITEP